MLEHNGPATHHTQPQGSCWHLGRPLPSTFTFTRPEAAAHTPLAFETHLHQAPVLGWLPCSRPHQDRAEAGEAALPVRGGRQVLPHIHRRPPCTQPGQAHSEPAQVARDCTAWSGVPPGRFLPSQVPTLHTAWTAGSSQPAQRLQAWCPPCMERAFPPAGRGPQQQHISPAGGGRLAL